MICTLGKILRALRKKSAEIMNKKRPKRIVRVVEAWVTGMLYTRPGRPELVW